MISLFKLALIIIFLSNDSKKWLPGVNKGLNVPKFVAINRGIKKN